MRCWWSSRARDATCLEPQGCFFIFSYFNTILITSYETTTNGPQKKAHPTVYTVVWAFGGKGGARDVSSPWNPTTTLGLESRRAQVSFFVCFLLIFALFINYSTLSPKHNNSKARDASRALSKSFFLLYFLFELIFCVWKNDERLRPPTYQQASRRVRRVSSPGNVFFLLLIVTIYRYATGRRRTATTINTSPSRGHFGEAFNKYHTTIHRYETNRLRSIAQFFGHLFSTNSISWMEFDFVKFSDDTVSRLRAVSRIFLDGGWKTNEDDIISSSRD